MYRHYIKQKDKTREAGPGKCYHCGASTSAIECDKCYNEQANPEAHKKEYTNHLDQRT